MNHKIAREANRLGFTLERAEYVRGGWGEEYCPGMWVIEGTASTGDDIGCIEYTVQDVIKAFRKDADYISQNVKSTCEGKANE